MLGFKAFAAAQSTLTGIELMHMLRKGQLEGGRDVLPGMNAGASLSAVPSPIEGSGTAWVLLGSWALSPARPTPIPPRHECRGFSALLVRRAAVRPNSSTP